MCGTCKPTNFTYGKTLLTEAKFLYVSCNEGSRIIAVEWIEVNMWCVNLHMTNEMLVCINSKLSHADDWIILLRESMKPLWVWICGICWIKLLKQTIDIVGMEIDTILKHTIIIVAMKIDTVVLLDYSNLFFGLMYP
jgi:hypothetical protein